MTLVAGSSDIAPSPPILPDASHRAADRDVEPHNKASVPPGESCLRCGGLLVSSYTASWERDVTDKPMTLWRCVNCGDCVDCDILANRQEPRRGHHPLGRPLARNGRAPFDGGI